MRKNNSKHIIDKEDFTDIERQNIELCCEPAAFKLANSIPLREAGFSLKKQRFCGVPATRYTIPMIGFLKIVFVALISPVIM